MSLKVGVVLLLLLSLDPSRSRYSLNEVTDVALNGRTFTPLRLTALPAKEGSIWLRFRIHQHGAEPRRKLVFTLYVDRAELFVSNGTSKYARSIGGMRVPYRSRAVPTVEPSIPLPPDALDGRLLYVHVHAEDLRFAMPALAWNFPTDPAGPPVPFYLITLGIVLGIALYHLTLYAVLRDGNILLYVLYLFAFVAYELTSTGLAWAYVWPAASLPAISTLRVTIVILAASVCAFARSFMHTRVHAPLADRALLASVAGMTASTALGFAAPALAAGTSIVADLFVLAGITCAIWASIAALLKRQRAAIFFCIGFAGLFAGAVAKIVADDSGHLTSIFHLYAMETGVTFDVIVLAFGLGDRIRAETRKREQAEATAAENRRLARTDALTGIANRRVFDESLELEWERALRFDEPISLIMIDVDAFKRYNDIYGHLAGDACLRRIGQAGHTVFKRAGELIARYGGEEFAGILPRIEAKDAERVAHLLQEAVVALNIPHAGSRTNRVSVSVGVATMRAHGNTNASMLVDAADRALYVAKARLAG